MLYNNVTIVYTFIFIKAPTKLFISHLNIMNITLDIFVYISLSFH